MARNGKLPQDIVLNDKLFEAFPIVYRILPIGDLIQTLISGKLIMVKPQKWECLDPFENFMLNAPVIDANGNERCFSFKDTVYAQCWSALSLSDAMWRLYSPSKDGVRIKVSSEKLFNALIRNVPVESKHCCYFGNVVYKRTQELYKIQKKLLDECAYVKEPANIVKTLLYKRTAFKHESEIRLIFHPDHDYGDTFEFNINPTELIQTLVFDPRMEEKDFLDYKKKLLDEFELFSSRKIPENHINQSTLYNRPKKWPVYQL